MGAFLIKKTLLKAILIPFILASAFHLFFDPDDLNSEHACIRKTRGCLKRLPPWLLEFLQGKLAKTVNSMPQHAQLTTWLEVAVIWGPLVPLLSLAVLAAVATNFLVVQLALSRVKQPSDADENDLRARPCPTRTCTLRRCQVGSCNSGMPSALGLRCGFLLLPLGVLVMLPQTLMRPVLRRVEVNHSSSGAARFVVRVSG